MNREELSKALRAAAEPGGWGNASQELLLAAAQAIDDGDRRAGAAERSLKYARDSESKRSSWLVCAKRDEGYTDNDTFDDVWANVRAERDRLRQAVEADPVRADTERLDWLDSVNKQTNDKNGNKYGWRFDLNHNRAALMDHNVPALSVREAIDQARGAH